MEKKERQKLKGSTRWEENVRMQQKGVFSWKKKRADSSELSEWMFCKGNGAIMEVGTCIFSSDLPLTASCLFTRTKLQKAKELGFSNSVTSV